VLQQLANFNLLTAVTLGAVGGTLEQQQWHRLFVLKAKVAVQCSQVANAGPGYVCV